MRTLFLSKVNEDPGLGFSDGTAICIDLRDQDSRHILVVGYLCSPTGDKGQRGLGSSEKFDTTTNKWRCEVRLVLVGSKLDMC